ncbi:hypothetical protein LINPERHAP1_LOCUS4836 [Linum perenne]
MPPHDVVELSWRPWSMALSVYTSRPRSLTSHHRTTRTRMLPSNLLCMILV